MGRQAALTRLDRPWHRQGAARYALARPLGLLRPPVEVYEPASGSPEVLRDLPVAVRDGTVLRVNVVLPTGGGRFPVLMSAHPYGKDHLPTRRGRRWRVSAQYRILRQASRVWFSSLTGWEAPDPAWWAAQGYAVANCDLRGAGTSGGKASLLSDQEAEDVYDLIEWAAVQRWSAGAVGMLGVSYLAISQWKAAALGPPHLKAICPWEGFTDAYRDLACPGGIPEQGFTRLWSLALRKVRQSYRLTEQQRAHPLRDDWWQALVPDLGRITVPALVCGSFSDNNLHSRGSFRGWHRSPVPRSSSTPTAAASGPPSTRPMPAMCSWRFSTGTCEGPTCRPRRGCGGSPAKPRCHHQRPGRGRLAAGTRPVDAAVSDRRRADRHPAVSG